MNHVRNAYRAVTAQRRGQRGLGPFRCAACGSNLDVRSHGAAAFCAECRAQADGFTGKELYTDIGGGD